MLHTADTGYLRAGVEVSIHVDGEYRQDRNRVATVLVYGILCLEDHAGQDATDEEN